MKSAKKYSKPVLKTHGPVRKFTWSASGKKTEGASGKSHK